MKHKHYSPRAAVVLVDVVGVPRSLPLPVLTERVGFIGLNSPDAPFEIERICGSVREYAHSIFEFFRECDRNGIDTIVCEAVDENGIGAALMDRLRRAAE